jgi:hypothetical protein
MRTLNLRNVPDEVFARLERLAAVESISVNALAVRELADPSRRVDDVTLQDALPDSPVPRSVVVEALDSERGQR